MKTSSFTRFDPADYPGFPPEWKKFLGALNSVLDEQVQAIQGNLTFGDNLDVDLKKIRAKHGVAQDVEVRLKGQASGGALLYSSGFQATATVTSPSAGKARITVFFTSPPATEVDCTVLVTGE